MSAGFSKVRSLVLALACGWLLLCVKPLSADSNPFTDKDALDQINAKRGEATDAEALAYGRIAKSQGMSEIQKIRGDNMDGGTSDAFANHIEDIFTLAEQMSPFGSCVSPRPIGGICIDWGDCPSKTYGCVCIDMMFYEFELCLYWKYRAPVQKIETNRTFRTGYWPQPVVSLMGTLHDTLMMDDLVAMGEGADLARAKNAGITANILALHNVKKDYAASIDVDSKVVSEVKSNVSKLPIPSELKHRSTEYDKRAQAYAEYHVMEEFSHRVFRQVYSGFKYHFEKVEKNPYLPFFSEGQGVLGSRISSFSWLGFPKEMGKLEVSPLACMMMNAAKGRTPADLYAKFDPTFKIRGSGGSSELMGDINECLGKNQGGWIPVTSRNNQNYIASSAALNFYKGTFSATNQEMNLINHSDFYSYQIPETGGSDVQDDRVMWLRNDRMKTGCIETLDGKFPLEYGNRGDASAIKDQKDPFFSIVEWRRFRTCPTDYNTYGPGEWNE